MKKKIWLQQKFKVWRVIRDWGAFFLNYKLNCQVVAMSTDAL